MDLRVALVVHQSGVGVGVSHSVLGQHFQTWNLEQDPGVRSAVVNLF